MNIQIFRYLGKFKSCLHICFSFVSLFKGNWLLGHSILQLVTLVNCKENLKKTLNCRIYYLKLPSDLPRFEKVMNAEGDWRANHFRMA